MILFGTDVIRGPAGILNQPSAIPISTCDGKVEGALPTVWTDLPNPALEPGSPNQAIVWTGDRLLVWGSESTKGGLISPVGFFLTLSPVSWHRISAPSSGARAHFAYTWTGAELLIWGGTEDDQLTPTGLRYNVESDRWSEIPPAPIVPRWDPTVVWTGSEMLVFAGFDASPMRGGRPLRDGAAFNPESGRWRRIEDIPGGGHESSRLSDAGNTPLIAAVWTGDVVLAVGGFLADDYLVYDPVTNSWEEFASPIGQRAGHTLTWTGAEAVVVGGLIEDRQKPDGASWNPQTLKWRALATWPGFPRAGHGAAYAFGGLLVWGGFPARANGCDGQPVSNGLFYNLVEDEWLSVPGPALSWGDTSVIWTGESVVVWGAGRSGLLTLATD